MNTIYIDLTNTSKHVEVEKLQMRKDNNGNDLNISKSPPERDCDSINFSQRNRKSINLSDDSAMYRSTKHIENKTNEVIASTPIMSWDKYRPRGAMNFSDLLEDKTIDARNMSPSVSTPNLAKNIPIDKNHGPAAASVRDPLKESTSNAQNMSVNMILDSSFVQAIRDRSKMVANIDRKQSTAENMTSANSSKPISNVSKNNFSQRISESIRSDEFVPFDEAQEKIDQDEKEWQNEFGALPAESDSVRSSEKSVGSYRLPQSKLVNLTEFSGYLADSNAEFSKMSLGNFFARRTEDIRTIIPNKSPSKIHKPVPLIASTNTSVSTGYESSIVSGKTSASTSFYTDDELKIKSLPKINNATYDKKPVNSERSSVLSVSNIANKLNDDAADSPATIVSQFTTAMRSKSMKSLNSVSQASSQASSTNSNNFMKKFTTIDQQKNPNEIPKDFATLRQELGMLAQMNSTAFDELPKGGRWRPNESAETESICESSLNITDFHTDFSSTGYGYDSSAPKNAHRDKKGAKKVQISPPTQAEDTRKTKGKRMRSPSSNPPDRIVDVHVPEISFQNLQISSPSKAQRTSDENRAPAKVDASHMPRQLMVDRSPIDGSKFSLPNYGLKARSISSSPTAVGIGRTNSQCSTNSEFYQNDGKFPLKSNRMAISWECVKLRKGISKSFFIKNTSMKRMTLNMEVTGPGFQIESSSQTSGPLILQGNECRTISVVFCPTVLGKAIGKVIFRPLKGWSEDTERHVYLFGYGGSTTLQLRGIERGPVGSAFLKMAETSTITSTSLKRWFSIYNKGPLPGMATITTKPKSNQYINDTHVIIEPNKCVIAPDSSVDVMVTYKLRRKDLEKLSQKSCEVLTVATLEVIIGADANRQRIVEILTNTENNIPAIYKSLNFLVDDFPNKHAENMSEYRESVDDVGDLFSCFKTTEVALTINRTTLDETRDTCNELSGIEDSVFFRTLIGSGSVDRAEAGGGHGNGNGTTLNRSHKLSVSPTRLFMDQLNNTSKTLTIKNEYNRTQTFQIESNFRHLISFSKSSGRISAGRELNVDVHLKTGVYVPNEVIITVYIESDCIEIPVTVKPTQINHINKF